MSLKVNYETVEEAAARLSGTVVLYDKEPVYIVNVTGVDNGVEAGTGDKDIYRVFITPLPYSPRRAVDPLRKYISSRKFDLSPFKMGALNTSVGAMNLTRTTARQYRQGLNEANFRLSTPWAPDRMQNYNWNLLLDDKGFVEMINGKYPSLKEGLDSLSSGANAVALSRNTVITPFDDFGISFAYHQGTKCGLMFKDDEELTIPNKFNFLKEEFEENAIRFKTK